MTEREKVINDLQDAVNDDWMWQHADYYALTMERAIALLKEQEPRTAHWFISEYEYITCSCCGEDCYTGADSTEEARQWLADGRYYKFCPHCGARMDAQEAKWDG